jgi:glyoxylate reductase
VSARPIAAKAAHPVIVLCHPLIPAAVRRDLAPRARVIRAYSRAAQRRALARADAVITTLLDRVDEEFLGWGPRLRAVGNCAVGVNNIDLAACARRGIGVANTPRVLTRATAELTLGLLLAAARRFPEGEALCRAGRFRGWAPDMLLGQELRGRHAVIVGPGRIGRETARLFRAVGLTVEFLGRDARPAAIDAALARAQVLSLHAPLTAGTRHWLSAARIRRLPRECIVLNTARGPLVDESALASALRSGRIFAAGLDVYEREPAIPLALRRLRNVILLPHLGSATEATRTAMTELAISGTLGLLDGKRPWNTVKTQGK